MVSSTLTTSTLTKSKDTTKKEADFQPLFFCKKLAPFLGFLTLLKLFIIFNVYIKKIIYEEDCCNM